MGVGWSRFAQSVSMVSPYWLLAERRRFNCLETTHYIIANFFLQIMPICQADVNKEYKSYSWTIGTRW